MTMTDEERKQIEVEMEEALEGLSLDSVLPVWDNHSEESPYGVYRQVSIRELKKEEAVKAELREKRKQFREDQAAMEKLWTDNEALLERAGGVSADVWDASKEIGYEASRIEAIFKLLEEKI